MFVSICRNRVREKGDKFFLFRLNSSFEKKFVLESGKIANIGKSGGYTTPGIY